MYDSFFARLLEAQLIKNIRVNASLVLFYSISAALQCPALKVYSNMFLVIM